MRERIYIVPTRFGFLYGFGIFVTISAGVIYSNNLVYLLSFFLVSLIVIGMIQTHNNIKGLQIEKVSVGICPEKGSSQAKLWIKTENVDSHNQIEIISKDKKQKKFSFIVENLSPKSLKIQTFSFQGSKRGRYSVGKIKVSSRFPFGLFEAWKVTDSNEFYYVYPKPISHLGREYDFKLGESFEKKEGRNGEDFTQHNRYKLGDSPRHIDWKALAKGRGLLTKEFKDGDRQSVWIDFESINGSVDIKLEQMSFWVIECERLHHYYTVKLKDKVLGPGMGTLHKEKCLMALAEFGMEDAA